MPNLCFNVMTVEGPAAELCAFSKMETVVKDGRCVLGDGWEVLEGGDVAYQGPNIVCSFVTAWEPPFEMAGGMSCLYPSLKITIQYDCSESDWTGLAVWREGDQAFSHNDEYVTDYADPAEIEEELADEYDDPTELAEAVAKKRRLWDALQAAKRAAAAL